MTISVRLNLHSSINKYQAFTTKLGQNIHDHKIMDEFDYGSNRTRTTVFLKKKNAVFDFVYTLAPTNFNQSAPNLVRIHMTIVMITFCSSFVL